MEEHANEMERRFLARDVDECDWLCRGAGDANGYTGDADANPGSTNRYDGAYYAH